MGHDFNNKVLDGIVDPAFSHDSDFRLVFVNDAYCHVAGVSRENALGKRYWEVFPLGTGPLAECRRVVDGLSHNSIQEEIKVSDKTYISNSYRYCDDTDPSPRFLHILVDVTTSSVVNAALGEALGLLQTIINNVPVRIFWKDRELRYLGANTLFAHDAGYASGEDLICKTDLDMPWREQAESYRADDMAVIASGTPKLEYEEQQTTPNGNVIWLSTSKVPLRNDNGDIIGILGIYYDITDHKISEDKTRQLAMTDQLTGLSNRHQFLLQATQSLKLAKRENKALALMMLDLDKFKPVNDTFDHLTGDAVLREVARIFKNSTRETDVVARIGGDEFAILLVHPHDVENAGVSAQKIIDAVKIPMTLAGHKIEIGVSIGIAVYPEDGDDLEALIEKADMALYRTKENGHGAFTFWSPDMQA